MVTRPAARATTLACAALLGLAVEPLLHAEQHHAEERLARERAIEEVFRLAFSKEGGPEQKRRLAVALEEAFAGRPAPHGHSHPDAPDQPGKPHGLGSALHLTAALHHAAPHVVLLTPRPRFAPVAPPRRAEHQLVRYLVVEQPQGPPRC